MKRLIFFTTTLFFILGAPAALASNSNTYNSSQNQDQNYPAPYTGGAPVAKYFHLSDGSTMTITTTGAVVKQARNGTPYRQGWINPADINQINSFQDLRGRLAYGDTNPYLNVQQDTTYQAESSNTAYQQKTNSLSTSPTPAKVVNNTATATYTTISTKDEPAQPAASVRTLPKTGPASAIPLAAVATIFSGIGHYIYKRRQIS